jgi:hypothetical protein
MVSISGMGVCGGNDFRYQFLKEVGLSGIKAGGHCGKNSRYDLDSKILSKPLKVRSYSSYQLFASLNYHHFSLQETIASVRKKLKRISVHDGTDNVRKI